MKKLCPLLFAAALAMLAIPTMAQFTPGQEKTTVSVGGGQPTTLDAIRQVSAGRAVLPMRSINAVFLNGVPQNVKAHFQAPDDSGKGAAYVVDVAKNPALANTQLCWRGVGSNWGKMVCGPIVNGNAEVPIDVGTARNSLFALVPVLMDGRTQVAWAAHPENTQVMLECAATRGRDMASLFLVDGAGAIHIATASAQVADYQKHYQGFCAR